MKSRHLFVAFFFLPAVVMVAACTMHQKPKDHFRRLIPAFIKDTVYLDTQNPFTPAKAELGRYLFFDRRLSVNNTKSCATCHDPAFSFTDRYNRSIGALGDLHQRNASPLINIVFNRYLTAADSSLHFPEQQIRNPMFNENPVELGWKGNEITIIRKVKADSLYQQLFKKAFPFYKDPVTVQTIQYAISSFVKTILVFNSPYDRFRFQNDSLAMTKAARRGMQLFLSDSLQCSRCHNGINLSTPVMTMTNKQQLFYFNTGLYNTDGKGGYPVYDQGLIEKTKQPRDMGAYRVPTLRNLAYTAPFFHDGSAQTLEDVIKVYEQGGRNVPAGVFTGDGKANPFKSPLIKGFSLNSQQRLDLVQFLLSCSDSSVLNNPAWANPFDKDETYEK